MIIGLTGGIGSGKSVAAKFFQEEGVMVVDADQLARKVIEKNTPGFAQVVNYFSKNILDINGAIDRAKLREEVFNNEVKRKALESITHPLVKEMMSEKISAAQSPYSIIMVPLIFETNTMSSYNRILVIDCDLNLQLTRASSRDKSSNELIKKIINSQCTREERLSIANDVIPNNDSLESLQIRSQAMHKYYLGLCDK